MNDSHHNALDNIERIALTVEEIIGLRKLLRLRFAGFIGLVVVLALISVYDNNMVKLLMMFLLVVLFFTFLKYHLRLKIDIEEGEKCIERIELKNAAFAQTGAVLLAGAYGPLKLKNKKGTPNLVPEDAVDVSYLPLSNRVLSWKKN